MSGDVHVGASGRSGRSLSRRSFLQRSGGAGVALATGLLGAGGLAGCAGDARGGALFDLGSASSLRILNWAEYIDPELIPEIARQMSIAAGTSTLPDVDYREEYEDNAEAWELLIQPGLSNGRSLPWDIIVPTNWLAARMIAQDMVEPIPIEIIPNHANIDPAFMTQGWDRGARMQMPWQAGITGVAYNPELTERELTSIADLFDPAFQGRVGMIGEMREALGLVMLAAGDDPSRPTVVSAGRAMDQLEALNDQQRFVWGFNEFADGLRDGSLVASMAWSGDTVLLQQDLEASGDGPDIRFVIPDDGAIQWFDTMVIPRGSPNVAAAGHWMNVVYDPVMAASITEWVQYISPVVGVRDELLSRGGDSAALATNAILFPDDTTRRRLFTWGQLPEADEAVLEARFAQLVP